MAVAVALGCGAYWLNKSVLLENKSVLESKPLNSGNSGSLEGAGAGAV